MKPNWHKANQLAVYNCEGREFELEPTEKYFIYSIKRRGVY